MCSKLTIKTVRSGIGYNIITKPSKNSLVYIMQCFAYYLRPIWYHLYYLKNVKNTHEGVLLLVNLQASV